jgi:uncharacterized protein Yka (UPF0111/DUF47 family)
MMKDKLKPIIGYPNYAMDVEKGVVYSFARGRLQRIKVRTNAHSNHEILYLSNGEKKITAQLNRLWYAVMNGLDYESLPRSFCICREGDKLVVETRQEVTRKGVATRRRKDKLTRLEHLDRKMRELEIMKRYYTSFDPTECMQYVETMHENFVKWIKWHYSVSQDFADDIWSESFLEMERRIKEPESRICDITLALKGVIKQVKKSIKERYQRETAEWRKNILFGKENKD